MILFDTDICIELLRGNKEVIAKRALVAEGVAVSFMTAAELYYGAEKSSQAEKNISLVDTFLLTVHIINSSLDSARKFGELKAGLAKQNTMVSDADIFIAAACLVHCTRLITGNVKHFKVFDALRTENWLEPG